MRRLCVSPRSWLFGQVFLLVLISGCGNDKTPYESGWQNVCIDRDGDGHGFQCTDGPDCDDENGSMSRTCPSCTTPSEGCACDANAAPLPCELPLSLTANNGLLCRDGFRYCRSEQWSRCEGSNSYETSPTLAVAYQSLIQQDAGLVGCSPCHPDCYRVDDPLTSVADAAVTLVPSGGITLSSSASDAGTDAGLLDDKACTPGTAPDTDCDGIPDVYDPYPSAPPFQTNHDTIFMGLAPGQSLSQDFKISFALNTADIYFYLDMTASMEAERDNLINTLTVGNFLPAGGLGISCADTNFDGIPNISLTTGGIAANIACLIRDVRIGAGWFRDIPFTGPFANGIKVAPTDLEMFQNRQDVTSDIVAVLAALTSFKTRGNFNPPEGGMQGLYSLITGKEIYAGWDRPGVPKRDTCPADTWGYPCFRNGAVPIIIHITDAPLQNGPSPTSVARANYLSDCVPSSCTCNFPSCLINIFGVYVGTPTCTCPNSTRNPLNYDSSVLSGMHSGTEGTYRKLTATAETTATAQVVGTIDNALVTYTGSTQKMSNDLTYAGTGGTAATGNCGSGTGWDSTSQTAPDAVFRFTVASNAKYLTISTRGSYFDTALMVKQVSGSSSWCSDDIASSTRSEITRKFAPGDYYAIVKGQSALESDQFQVTFGDTDLAVDTSFNAQRWLGPSDLGPNGIRAALLARGVKVITVNSSLDPYLAEQSAVLANSTGAVDLLGQPLTLQIGSDGIGLGLAVLNAVTLLSKQLAMDVGVVLKEEPDNPTPDFGFVVQAIDRAGDGCGPPVDKDNDAAHLPDTHTNCLPGATPQFKVTFTNRAAPNSVPPNPTPAPGDTNGGYNMKLQLIGNGTYVVDQIPVYIIPSAVAGSPGVPVYQASGSYEQIVTAAGCSGTTLPLWRDLSWNALIPAGTNIKYEICSGDSDAEVAACNLSTIGVLTSGATCTTSATCPNGYCDSSGVCHYVNGLSCSVDADCGASGVCASSSCMWTKSQIDLKPAYGPNNPQGKLKTRVRMTLNASADKTRAPTLYNWRLDYDCTPML